MSVYLSLSVALPFCSLLRDRRLLGKLATISSGSESFVISRFGGEAKRFARRCSPRFDRVAGCVSGLLPDKNTLVTHILTIRMSAGYRQLSMNDTNTDVIQGTLDMLILKTLSLEPLHGFGISRRVEQITRGVFKVNPGSLLTALQRLERAGWLDAEWKQTENSRRAKIYSLTRAGRKQLELETADWNRRSSAIARLLKAEI